MYSRLIAAIAVTAACTSENRAEPASVSARSVDEPARDAPTFRLFVDPGASELTYVREAVAVMSPTSGNRAAGTVRFRETRNGVDVVATIDGLPRGGHAYHVHVYGDCSTDDAASAGPHFHFAGSSFDRGVRHITGNLGELRSDGDGTTTHRNRLHAASLQGRFSLIGRAVVIHARPNDPAATPDGGAGDRVACGVIGVSGDAWQKR